MMTQTYKRISGAVPALLLLSALAGCSDSTSVQSEHVYAVSVTAIEVDNKDTGQPVAGEPPQLRDSVLIVPAEPAMSAETPARDGAL